MYPVTCIGQGIGFIPSGAKAYGYIGEITPILRKIAMKPCSVVMAARTVLFVIITFQPNLYKSAMASQELNALKSTVTEPTVSLFRIYRCGAMAPLTAKIARIREERSTRCKFHTEIVIKNPYL